MALDKKHAAWLKFVRDVLAVPLGLSETDLVEFRELARREYPTIAPIVEEYARLARRSETAAISQKPTKRRSKSGEMHLFDLLREKKFFPQNLDLARFASRVVPKMRSYRFDKMSRSDIAARVIEYLESSDPRTRGALETSMRDALDTMSGRETRETERQSYLSKWERIIKGTEL